MKRVLVVVSLGLRPAECRLCMVWMQVHKAEQDPDQYHMWWEAADPGQSSPTATLSDAGKANSTASDPPRVSAMGGESEDASASAGTSDGDDGNDLSLLMDASQQAAAAAPEVHTAGGSAEEQAGQGALARWLLAQVGLEAQALLAGGAPPVLAFAPGPELYVDPRQISNPGDRRLHADGTCASAMHWYTCMCKVCAYILKDQACHEHA
jgi:hypothetical protein